jgi:hypothetical protein
MAWCLIKDGTNYEGLFLGEMSLFRHMVRTDSRAISSVQHLLEKNYAATAQKPVLEEDPALVLFLDDNSSSGWLRFNQSEFSVYFGQLSFLISSFEPLSAGYRRKDSRSQSVSYSSH